MLIILAKVITLKVFNGAMLIVTDRTQVLNKPIIKPIIKRIVSLHKFEFTSIFTFSFSALN